MTSQHFLQVNALCRGTCWNRAVISPCRPRSRWYEAKTELLEQQHVSKSSLEDFECVLCCSKKQSLFHPAASLLGCDLWKVTSPRAISFSMYSWMFEEQFPRNSVGSNRELAMTLTKEYGTVDLKTSYGTRWQRLHIQIWDSASALPVGSSL